MGAILINRRNNYGWILGRQVAPGGELDLEDVFEGFCKPKVSSKDQAKKLEQAKKNGDPIRVAAQFTEDQFDEFLDWVENEVAIDRSRWYVERSEEHVALGSTEPIAQLDRGVQAKPAVAQGKRGNAQQRLTKKDIKRKLPSEQKMKPKELAWLPANDDSRKLIDDLPSDYVKTLKAALKLAKGRADGQRTAKMLQDKLDDLAMEGVS